MTHADLTLRILISLANIGTYLYWRKQIRKENERRAVREWLFTAIRGAR